MGVPGSANFFLAGSVGGYQISRSLRFNSADGIYLTRPFATPTNSSKWTMSMWAKRSSISSALRVLFGKTISVGANFYLGFDQTTDTLTWTFSNAYSMTTAQVFRDVSAWYHIIAVWDSANATATQRARVYINGSEITTWSTDNRANITTSMDAWNTTSTTFLHAVGAASATASTVTFNFDGYLTEINFIDGQALTPSSFGETDTITGVWKPKRYTGTYGTNGFYLNFSDNSGTTSTTLGKDSSGNGNNWTPNNFSVTAGAGNDSMIDTPTPYADGGNGRGNYPTLNPLDWAGTAPSLSNGNLTWTTNTSAGQNTVRSSQYFPTTGKWYAEFTVTQLNIGSGVGYGLVGAETPNGNRFLWWVYSSPFYQIYNGTTYATVPTIATGDVIMVAVDMNAGRLWFGQNGTWLLSGNPSNGTAMSTDCTFTTNSNNVRWFVDGRTGSANNIIDCNFGQRAFAYTPPSGFLALNTQNLPTPTIKKPGTAMDVVTYTGTGAARSITGLGFSPDLVWVKSRTNPASGVYHHLVDSVRGASSGFYLPLYSNTTEAENTYPGTTYGGITSLNADGYSLGSSGGNAFLNNNTTPYVAWCWDKSATPGFDIVTYTGDGVNTRTISHSLGVTPAFFITKNRDGYNNANGFVDWSVYHKDLAAYNTTGSQALYLMSTTNAGAAGGFYTRPTSTVFTPNQSLYDNVSTRTYVAYLWSEVAGFSKFGSYTGNGSSDGPFVYCGFRPRWVMIKASSTGGLYYDWVLYDSTRMQYNTCINPLAANMYDNESYFANNYEVDLLSNGFKPRNTSGNSTNMSGVTYIFAAFAESPFKYSLAR